MLTLSSGETYSGDWDEDRRHGHGTLTTAGGDVYEGAFVWDKKHGRGKARFANGDTYEGTILSLRPYCYFFCF